MLRYGLAIATAAAGLLAGCQDGSVSIGDPPPAPEFSVDQSDPNNIIFKVTSAEGFMINWDFGNGMLSQKEVDTVYYPFADTYTVKLAVSNKGGATITEKELVIASTDPVICQNPYYTLLSGGCDAESKTWKVYTGDSAYANGPPAPVDSLGNGTSSYCDPIPSFWWFSKTVNDIPPAGALDDEYVFGLKGFTYLNDCHGDFYFSWKWCNYLFGATQATYADTVYGYTPNNPATWTLEEEVVTDTTGGKKGYFVDTASGESFNLILTLSNDNYIGYCSGVSIYQILEISEDAMYLRHELAEPDDPSATGPNRLEWRYTRLVAKE